MTQPHQTSQNSADYHAERAKREYEASRAAKSEYAAMLHLRLARLHEQEANAHKGCGPR